MNIFLNILLIIGILIVFLSLLALIIKKSYSIERDIIIDLPVSVIFDYVKLVRNQEQYNVWVMRDPNVNIQYSGIDGKVGFISAWHGNKQAGKGEQEIIEMVEDKFIKLELRFEEPFKNIGHTYMYTEQLSPTQTRVKYLMVGENKFPMTLFNLIIDGVLGKDLQQSLSNLKGQFSVQKVQASN